MTPALSNCKRLRRKLCIKNEQRRAHLGRWLCHVSSTLHSTHTLALCTQRTLNFQAKLVAVGQSAAVGRECRVQSDVESDQLASSDGGDICNVPLVGYPLAPGSLLTKGRDRTWCGAAAIGSAGRQLYIQVNTKRCREGWEPPSLGRCLLFQRGRKCDGTRDLLTSLVRSPQCVFFSFFFLLL